MVGQRLVATIPRALNRRSRLLGPSGRDVKNPAHSQESRSRRPSGCSRSVSEVHRCPQLIEEYGDWLLKKDSDPLATSEKRELPGPPDDLF